MADLYLRTDENGEPEFIMSHVPVKGGISMRDVEANRKALLTYLMNDDYKIIETSEGYISVPLKSPEDGDRS